ncbi:hypothetical protein OG897_31905 [Streptomyces sp. NBC_00237]|uniref:hypothetical protein n=1 Tax=Streptomyces sp. NBC_00237 TaxID=2975687 RepID=UPI00225B5266|nr:hypothetical protein [Streptomyces sp. NBC_00237]MCX5206011.1 hypothetical protein [Streptomyces sp. NBC_00237]
MSIRRATFAFAASTVAALAFAAGATPAQADEGDPGAQGVNGIQIRDEEIERVDEVLVEERLERPREVLAGDDAFERENIRADDLLNRAEVDRLRFDNDQWHLRHDLHDDDGPAIINQTSTIV